MLSIEATNKSLADFSALADPSRTASKRMIALVDCESFFASCERVFHPELSGRAIVVLSNNDGCVIALNREAKAAGMKMGTPWFKVREWAIARGVVARSSNYELYGSLSRRVMSIISDFSPWQEVYSIDESFIAASGSPAQLYDWARSLRARVMQETGIPVRVSIAETKTLAKLAALGAKHNLSAGGVCDLRTFATDDRERILASVPAAEVWGVGRRLSKRLAALGIHSVRELRDADLTRMRKLFSVNLARTILELRGVECIDFGARSLVNANQHKEQLIFSRSFARPVTSPSEMKQVLSLYAQRAAQRLRSSTQQAQLVTAWCATAYYKDNYRHDSHATALSAPSDDPISISAATSPLLEKMIPDAEYVRAGVVLSALVPRSVTQPLALFATADELSVLGPTLDRITASAGRGAVALGYAGLRQERDWAMRREFLSERATTEWSELKTVHA